MNRSLVAIVTCSLVACLWLMPFAAANSGPTPRKLAGVYLGEGEFFDGEQVTPFQYITRFNDDGTFDSSDTNDFEFMGSGLDGLSRGTWVKTGPLGADSVSLHFTHDANGDYLLTGRLESTIDAVDESGDVFEGEGVLKVYLPGMDPLDSESGIVVGTFTLSSRRLVP